MWFDIVVGGILLMALWRGAAKGFVWQLASIAALVLCFAFAESFSVALAPMITVKPPLNRWIAMFLLYVAFSFLSFGIARQLRDWLAKAQFIEYDRHLGAVFGLIKGGVICLLLTFFVVTLSGSLREQVLVSHSGKAAAIIMDRLHPVMPEELHEVLEPYIHQLDRPDLDLQYVDHHNGTGHPDSSPSPGRPNSSQTDPPPNSSEPVSPQLVGLVENLIGVSDPQLVRDAVTALRNTDNKDRTELIGLLSSRIPGLIRSTVEDWQQGKPDRAGQNETDRLLREISAIYFEYPRSQDAFIEETREQIDPLPQAIQVGVLRDLYADLLNEDPDPDPGTNFRTALDERIARQLNRSRSASDFEFPWN